MFSETHPQIKFEDGSVKQNILIACTGLAIAPFSCLKWLILKKIRKDYMDVVQYFTCVFSFKGRSGEWRGFFSYLRRNLVLHQASLKKEFSSK